MAAEHRRGVYSVGGLVFRSDFDSGNLDGVTLASDGVFQLSVAADGKGTTARFRLREPWALPRSLSRPGCRVDLSEFITTRTC